MRIDNDAEPAGFELDPRARLRHYLELFRRQWYVVLVPLVLGAALGWFTAPAPPSKATKSAPVTVPKSTYYEATHVLLREDAMASGNSSGNSTPVNLPQAAYLVNTGEVPIRVAQQLGLSADDVESRLLGMPRDQVSAIEVSAVGTDAAQVVAMADAAAKSLLDVLKAQAEQAAAARRDSIIAQLDDLNGQLDQLNAQIAFNPPDKTQLEAQQRSISNQYSLVFQQFTDLANQPPATAGLVSLENAKAKSISDSDYRERLRTIREGASYVTGNSPPATVAPTEVEEVKAPGKPVGPGTRSLLGGLVGLAIGVGLVLLLDRFDARLRRREDVETASGLTVIAAIPRLPRKMHRSTNVIVQESPRSRAAEAYRVVRGAAVFALSKMTPTHANGTTNPAAVLMVTSAEAGEGKTTTVANLAAVFAEGGLNVLVVNCDFRRPHIHRFLLEDPSDEALAESPATPVATTIDRVHLIASVGETTPDTSPLEVVALQRQVIAAYRGSYHVILLDTAPFLATNDASELLAQTDLVMLVVRSGRTTREHAHRVVEVLGRFSAPVLGVVFNGEDENRGAQYYTYGYSYSYGERPGDAATQPAPEVVIEPMPDPAAQPAAAVPPVGPPAAQPAPAAPPVAPPEPAPVATEAAYQQVDPPQAVPPQATPPREPVADPWAHPVSPAPMQAPGPVRYSGN